MIRLSALFQKGFYMSQTSRRQFLQATAGVALAPYFLSSEQPAVAQAVSDRIRIGCVGFGGMGRGDASSFSGIADVVALCDVDAARLDAAANDGHIGRLKPDKYKDYRKIIERKDIDVVSISTVDHWHVKIAIEAMQAGKHVFCQKPLTLTVEEGQLIRAACKKYDKLAFQVGTQQRSEEGRHFLNANILIKKGIIGEVKKILCDIGGSPSSPLSIPVAPVPETLDWDMWLGQAPKTDYLALTETREDGSTRSYSRCHGVFRYWYEYSGGTLTDWGAHHVDCSLWFLGQDRHGAGPVKFKPIVAEHPVPFEKGYPTVSDRYNTSTRFDIECTFESGAVMNIVSRSEFGNGILLEGTEGRIHVSRGHLNGAPIEALKDKQNMGITEEDYVKAFNGKKREGHRQNFLTCVREGGVPISDAVSHVQAMNVCHLAAISARLGREVQYDPKTEKTGDAQSQAFIARERRKEYDIPKVG
jgi:predicted dehydrogenase